MSAVSSNDPRIKCRLRYDELAEECRSNGLEASEIDATLALSTRIKDGSAWLKSRAFKPTGVALGCPLPDRLCQEALQRLAVQVDMKLRYLRKINKPAFAAVPPDSYHITLANYDHFDLRDNGGPVSRLRPSHKSIIEKLIATEEYGHLRFRLSGVVLTRQGRLMIRGHAETLTEPRIIQ